MRIWPGFRWAGNGRGAELAPVARSVRGRVGPGVRVARLRCEGETLLRSRVFPLQRQPHADESRRWSGEARRGDGGPGAGKTAVLELGRRDHVHACERCSGVGQHRVRRWIPPSRWRCSPSVCAARHLPRPERARHDHRSRGGTTGQPLRSRHARCAGVLAGVSRGLLLRARHDDGS